MLAAAALAAAGCATPKVAAPKDLPLTRVAVYRNGVGYFERSGKVRADRLRFHVRPEYIGDFLATLAVMERGGSSVRAASFPLRVEDRPPAPPPPEAPGTPLPLLPPLETVTLELDGGEHELAVGYITEQPVWKPSYRIVLGERGPTLQAWGVVQNLSGEDWNGVALSLVAGAPIAFQATLQTPVTPRRPVVNDSGELIGAVPRAQSSLAQRPPPPLAPPAPPPPPAAAAPRPSPRMQERPGGSGAGAPQMDREAPQEAESEGEAAVAPPAYTMADAAPRSASLLAAQNVEGGATRYDLPHPVTVPHNSATMVLLLAQEVKGEHVFMFAPEGGVPDSARHPFRVVRFTNTTAGLLERGPIAVYEKSSFLGQGVLEPLSEGGDATIPFALERGLAVDTDRRETVEDARLSRIEHGQLHVERDLVVRTLYRVRNGRPEDARVVLRHPRLQGMRLHAPPPGTDEQVGRGLALVPLTATARGTAELTVDERRGSPQPADWLSPEADQAVRAYLADPRAAREVAEPLRQAWALREALVKEGEERARLQQEQGVLQNASAETRENLRSIQRNRSGVEELRRQLSARLAQLDTRLAELGKRLVELELSLSERRVRFTELLRDVKLAAPLPPA
jgi:hypothetical protein